MATPEMMLWLAGKMGVAVEMRGSFVCLAHGGKGYAPHTDPAQFGRMVVWAWQEGIVVDNRGCSILTEYDGGPTFIVDHDSTPDSIMAAATIAIARALGWEGE